MQQLNNKKMEKTEKNLNDFVDMILSNATKEQLQRHYEKLSFQEKIDLIQYMKATNMNHLFLKIRNHAENLAR